MMNNFYKDKEKKRKQRTKGRGRKTGGSNTMP
jgi:hypothetical protein